MKLYGYFRSSAAFRVRIALNLKGLAYEQASIHLRKNEQQQDDYLALNPQGLVPTLDDDGALLTQSLAIIEYLDETHPEPPLLPRDPLARARVRSLAQAIACDIHPIDNLRVLRYLAKPLGHDEKAVEDWFNHWIRVGFTGIERILATDGQAGDILPRRPRRRSPTSASCRRCSTRSAIRASTSRPIRRSCAFSRLHEAPRLRARAARKAARRGVIA